MKSRVIRLGTKIRVSGVTLSATFIPWPMVKTSRPTILSKHRRGPPRASFHIVEYGLDIRHTYLLPVM